MLSKQQQDFVKRQLIDSIIVIDGDKKEKIKSIVFEDDGEGAVLLYTGRLKTPWGLENVGALELAQTGKHTEPKSFEDYVPTTFEIEGFVESTSFDFGEGDSEGDDNKEWPYDLQKQVINYLLNNVFKTDWEAPNGDIHRIQIEFHQEDMSGVLSVFYKDENGDYISVLEGYTVYATPWWEGDNKLPIQLSEEGGDIIYQDLVDIPTQNELKEEIEFESSIENFFSWYGEIMQFQLSKIILAIELIDDEDMEHIPITENEREAFPKGMPVSEWKYLEPYGSWYRLYIDEEWHYIVYVPAGRNGEKLDVDYGEVQEEAFTEDELRVFYDQMTELFGMGVKSYYPIDTLFEGSMTPTKSEDEDFSEATMDSLGYEDNPELVAVICKIWNGLAEKVFEDDQLPECNVANYTNFRVKDLVTILQSGNYVVWQSLNLNEEEFEHSEHIQGELIKLGYAEENSFTEITRTKRYILPSGKLVDDYDDFIYRKIDELIELALKKSWTDHNDYSAVESMLKGYQLMITDWYDIKNGKYQSLHNLSEDKEKELIESLENYVKGEKHYMVFWHADTFEKYHCAGEGDCEIKHISRDWFTEEKGYSEYEISQIDYLDIGETWTSEEYGDKHIVTRVQ